MALAQGTATIAVTTQERTWRVEIETALGADPVVTVYRQTVKTDPSGNVLSIEMAPIARRALSAISAETQAFTPSVAGLITGGELAALIAARADVWRQADITAATGQPAPPAA